MARLCSPCTSLTVKLVSIHDLAVVMVTWRVIVWARRLHRSLPLSVRSALLYANLHCSMKGSCLNRSAPAGLLQGVEARVKRPEYARLLADCQAQYCGARLGLVEPVVRQRVAAFARQPLPTLTRSGCAHLMQVLALDNRADAFELTCALRRGYGLYTGLVQAQAAHRKLIRILCLACGLEQKCRPAKDTNHSSMLRQCRSARWSTSYSSTSSPAASADGAPGLEVLMEPLCTVRLDELALSYLSTGPRALRTLPGHSVA